MEMIGNDAYNLSIILAVSICILVGCGNSSETPSEAARIESKDLFSSWAAAEYDFILDLTNYEFSSGPIDFVFQTGESCQCFFSIGGTKTDGRYSLALCSFDIGSGSGIDPGCSEFNDSGSYSLKKETLTLCSSEDASCIVFY